MNAEMIVRNEDIFTLPAAAVTARGVLAQLEQLQEEIGGAPPPLSAESLGHQLYNRTVKSGSAPTAAELADLADDARGEAARRAYDAAAAAVHDAAVAFERSVRAGAADYLQQLRVAWGSLLAEVRELGDSVPSTPEEAVRPGSDVGAYQKLVALLQRADRIRDLHKQLLGELPTELRGGAFLDTTTAPASSEIAKVHRTVVTAAGPENPAARLKWLADQEPYLAPDVKTAERALMEWHREATNIPMDDGPRPSVRI